MELTRAHLKPRRGSQQNGCCCRPAATREAVDAPIVFAGSEAKSLETRVGDGRDSGERLDCLKAG